jgi:hypothetical protein
MASPLNLFVWVMKVESSYSSRSSIISFSHQGSYIV